MNDIQFVALLATILNARGGIYLDVRKAVLQARHILSASAEA